MILRTYASDRADQRLASSTGLAGVFSGKCGLSQCIAGYYIQDHLDPQTYLCSPVATQSLRGWWTGHALLSVTVRDCDALYILDPSFVQFIPDATKPTPVDFLRQSDEGALLADELIRGGVAGMDAPRAMLYAASFCQGKAPFETGEDALRFFRSPPPHPYHFHYDIGDSRFERPRLAQDGLLLKPGI